MNYQDTHGDWRHRRWMGRTVFDKPSVIGTKFDWVATCMVSLILQGNAWGFITGRDGYGYPTGIEWIPPEDVYVEEDPQQRWNPMRAQVYVYGRKVDWINELFHVKAFPLPGRIEGLSPLRAFAETILAGKEAMKYGTTWFQSGGFPPGTFKNNEIEIDGAQAEEMRNHLLKTLRQRVPLVYGRDWDYKPVTVNANEAQFIEALQLNATHIAAILNLPPDRLGGTRGDSLTYNTTEQSTLQVIEALRPWLVRLEEAFFDCLPQNRFARFYTDALLKTDLKTRMDIYVSQRNIGLRTVDELRELEDLPPLRRGVGEEALPLVLMQEMAARAGVIPRSILSSVVFEMDIAANRLEQYAQEHPQQNDGEDAGPVVQSPAQYLGSLITQQNRGGEAGREAEVRLKRIADRARTLEKQPEYIGAWIPESHASAPWINGKKTRDIVLDHVG